MGENIYMMLSDMNLNIRSRVVDYNNKILISDSKFVLGKNYKVNTLGLVKISHKVVLQPAITPQKQTITHGEEKVVLVLSLAGAFTIWYAFCQKRQNSCPGVLLAVCDLGL